MRPNNFVRLGALVTALIAAGAKRSKAFDDFRDSVGVAKLRARRAQDVAALSSSGRQERRLAEVRALEAPPAARAIPGLARLVSRRAKRRLAAIFEEERAAA